MFEEFVMELVFHYQPWKSIDSLKDNDFGLPHLMFSSFFMVLE